jgi:hypothetical protein
MQGAGNRAEAMRIRTGQRATCSAVVMDRSGPHLRTRTEILPASRNAWARLRQPALPRLLRSRGFGGQPSLCATLRAKAGRGAGTRTLDPLIKSQLLCQLSYTSTGFLPGGRKMEREKGFEPSTATLARWSSTTELLSLLQIASRNVAISVKRSTCFFEFLHRVHGDGADLLLVSVRTGVVLYGSEGISSNA